MPSLSLAISAGSLILILLATPAHSSSSNYELVETWQGKNFLDHFNFYVGPDPTNGYVTYLDQHSAQSAGLVKVTDSGSVYLGVDHKTKLDPSGKGRDSVRIESKKYYDHSLIVADIAHMPGSICGTWPAFWSVGRNWPADGEIDIIEGVNRQEHNEIVMHTGGTCSLTDQGMTGAVNATGCGEALGPVGCVVEAGQGSYGTSFNRQGGGVYTMQWTKQFVKIWFFPRHSIPPSITKGLPDVTQFGTPMALVQDGCDVATSFKAQSFVFDITFCGDWAGNVYGETGCPVVGSNPLQSCVNHVAQDPSAFEQTYWEINSVRIYQTGVQNTTSVSETHASTTHAAPETTDTETHVGTAAGESTTATHTAATASTAKTAHAGTGGELTVASAPTTEASSTTTSCTTCTHAERPATIYTTSFVTSTATICSETQSSLTAITASPTHVAPVASISKARAADDQETSQTVQSAVSETSVAHPINLAGTVVGQQNAATSTLTLVDATEVKNFKGVGGVTAGPEASAAVKASAAVNSNEGANDHAASSAPTSIASDSTSTNTASAETTSPAFSNPRGASSSFLPSLLPSRTSRSLIPSSHTSQSTPRGSHTPASSHTAVFTGAAKRVSGSIWSIAFACAVALLA